MKEEEPKVARVEFSSEHEGPKYFDENGQEIIFNYFTDNVGEQKLTYDFETKSINHWWFKNESILYFNVHTEIAKFRSRTTFGKYWKAMRKTLMHRYIWRHL